MGVGPGACWRVPIDVSPPPPSATSLASAPAEHSRWFREEVHAHDGQLKAYLRGSFPAVRDVEDVVQESYLKIWKAKLARPIESTKSFLFQVARNLALDQVRRNRISPEIPCPEPAELFVTDSRPGVAEAACTAEELEFLARAIESLPGRCREVMVLRQIKGLPQKEIAAQLGLSVLSVQTYVVRGLRRMEEYMRKHHVRP
jgi:RNA polymerase sigma factor (sigma-70 family)